MWADRFFDIWDKLPRQATADLDIPRYLQLLTLLSFHVFLKEGVDVAVYETHMGGRYDATNVIPSPVITAVTHVARDHIQYLGPDIETISWHKAGIIKQGTVVFSSIQEQAVVKVLQREASEKGVPITFVDKDHQLPVTTEFQRENCSLAVAVARSWLRIKGTGELAENSILEGVKLFDWPGRYQIIYRDKYQWFLDGAHNESSLPYAVQWFATACKAQR
jgi:folylpolyglutamate synthase